MPEHKPYLIVVAGVIEKDGCYFIAQRLENASQGGLWEFPGGKVEVGETPAQALERELYEELAIRTTTGVWLADSVFDYGDKVIELKGYLTQWQQGEIQLNSHQQMAWVELAQLDSYRFCAADYPIIAALHDHICAGK
ncbi:(deoxy)nucleoside triphosphate pyrophosphohydrolase [Photobacterium aquimaris]|uniref:8-oxo-dGTP diphosphatase n=1 Tax=Photobacterium aquimaris TaxID=512643 RepID=A0A2T3IS22_9GAMM|nr:(deoxy)nucleoside triphosphate pyrophosphohydrolase [Photobacterium aquimaris]OBU23448.1 5-methyl-dCTP pyrophosphohydrolase [Photobacterium aquimaris]PSU31154.1 (deoxy)nucleoside triphosphate pyrophosphohydrolase [Photobacterium aquimaris]